MSKEKTTLFTLSIVVIISLLCSISSCSKEDYELTDCSTSELSTKEQFAELLSAAITNSEELRFFIKKEALRQYDKDYDVFYPFVRDRIVYEGKTFRDCLLDYVEEKSLLKIENNNPFLTIYVPDWGWLGAFSVNDWDTSNDDVFVGIADNNSKHRLFSNGAYFGTLNEGEIPNFPIMIIKDNERMTLTQPATRAESLEYSFVDDAFDNSISTRVTAQEYRRYFAVNPGSNYVSKSDFAKFSPESIAAWKEYGDDEYESQRNLVYFNAKKNENRGLINPKIRESIVAIKLIDTNCIEEDEKDPHLHKAKRNVQISVMRIYWKKFGVRETLK